jgi:hypothetical protein
MGGFSVERYNQLFSIGEASSRFKRQLESAGLSDSQFFTELAPLFAEEGKLTPYSPCLVHHHFSLKEGERMISHGHHSAPSTDVSPNIVPEFWLNTGEEIEHRYVDNSGAIPPPPSADFFSQFKAIQDKYGIDTLGICYSPSVDDLAPGFSFLETLVTEERAHIINRVPKSSIDPTTTSPSVWTFEVGHSGSGGGTRCTPSSLCHVQTYCKSHND